MGVRSFGFFFRSARSNGLARAVSHCGVAVRNISLKIPPAPFKRNLFLRITVTFLASMLREVTKPASTKAMKSVRKLDRFFSKRGKVKGPGQQLDRAAERKEALVLMAIAFLFL